MYMLPSIRISIETVVCGYAYENPFLNRFILFHLKNLQDK